MNIVYLPIEISNRELLSKLLLTSRILQHKNSLVILGKKHQIIDLALKLRFPTSSLLHKSIVPGQLQELQKLTANNVTIYSQDEEHGMLQKEYKTFASSRFTESTIKLSANIFCWGYRDFNYLSQSYSQHEEKFILSGSPRVELWQRASKWLPPQKPHNAILFCSNISIPTNIQSFAQLIAEDLRWSQHKSKDNFDDWLAKYDYMKERFIESAELYNKWLQVIHTLSQDLPNLTFYIKPHPTEDLQAWHYPFKNLENVVILNNHSSIDELFPFVDIILHDGCTTGIQAYLAKKPCIAYAISNTSSTNSKITNQFSEIAHDISELSDKIKNFYLSYQQYKPKPDISNTSIGNLVHINTTISPSSTIANILCSSSSWVDPKVSLKHPAILDSFLKNASICYIYLSACLLRCKLFFRGVSKSASEPYRRSAYSTKFLLSSTNDLISKISFLNSYYDAKLQCRTIKIPGLKCWILFH